MREPSLPLTPRAGGGSRRAPAGHHSMRSSPPPPRRVGVKAGFGWPCATRASASSWATMGPVSPSPSIARVNWRRLRTPARTWAIPSRMSRSSISRARRVSRSEVRRAREAPGRHTVQSAGAGPRRAPRRAESAAARRRDGGRRAPPRAPGRRQRQDARHRPPGRPAPGGARPASQKSPPRSVYPTGGRRERRAPREERIAALFRRYQERLVAAAAADFDDLLLLTVRLFDEVLAVLAWYRGLWTHVLVDEYQDTNRAQYRIVRQLTAEHRNVCVVGDADQSIYKWRGADIRNILDFETDYPGTRVIRLEQNYRPTKRILALASAVIAHNVSRKDKGLWTENGEGERAAVYRAWDEHEEANFVAQTILAARGAGSAWDDIAVFYRTNAQSRVLEDALRRSGIPYVVVGSVRFYERREIKDALAYLRLVVNPADDVAFRRAIHTPGRA